MSGSPEAVTAFMDPLLAKVKEGMDQAGPDEVDEEEKQCIIDQTNEIKERLDTMLDEAEEDGDMDD